MSSEIIKLLRILKRIIVTSFEYAFYNRTKDLCSVNDDRCGF